MNSPVAVLLIEPASTKDAVMHTIFAHYYYYPEAKKAPGLIALRLS